MKTVLAHGCFDVLHIGHIRLLKYARSLGDELVVSLLADKYVRLYKGEGRPVNTLNVRIEQMRELRSVDRVVVVDGPGHESVQAVIAHVMPSVYVKGQDCLGKVPELTFLQSLGVEIEFMPVVCNDNGKLSSTALMAA